MPYETFLITDNLDALSHIRKPDDNKISSDHTHGFACFPLNKSSVLLKDYIKDYPSTL